MSSRTNSQTSDSQRKQNEIRQLENDYLTLNRQLTQIREQGLSSSSFSEHTATFKRKLKIADDLAAKAFETETSKCISMDCELLANISSFNPQLTELVETGAQTFSTLDFARKLITAINPSSALASVEEEVEEELASQSQSQFVHNTSDFRKSKSKVTFVSDHFSLEDLRAFGRTWSYLNNEAATYDFLLGAFESTAPAKLERTQRQRIKHNFDPTQRQAPEESKETDENDVVTVQVENLYERIYNQWESNEEKPIRMFEALIEPDSFSHTVSNLFHSAFLIKNGSINVARDENQKAIITPLRRDDEPVEKASKKNNRRIQSVLSFNMQDYQRWVDEAMRN